jgi:MSHA pilin protein MshC
MKHAGFSLVELISVIVIIGILAVVALPRFVAQSTFDGRGFYDQTLSALRYAQKTAIASRRDVCVTFDPSGSSIALGIATVEGAGAACGVGNLAGPASLAPYVINARSPVTYSPVPASFRFDALGRPSPDIPRSFQVSGLALDIVIEQETGYVHP